eukprot:CAMPEP_0181202210 /NCGR_PEP_ID=MMETSP1096-20121128/18718_1 /TAXON_ID=156174 ORGANISM="Chrysochromulina ericina, Strain CCMP281" /NCGR_SAMPLE_ID=MMETSP1096 /ASSEMBLY_ACC=CAM_ASM_000453 /LENGTH=126 /DNA_ID=CAMNT_0023292703 /DNA_START=743 /DNA_END=1119 /DNA_ORIENTATION=+
MIGDRKWFRRVAIYDERFRLAIAALGAHASQAAVEAILRLEPRTALGLGVTPNFAVGAAAKIVDTQFLARPDEAVRDQPGGVVRRPQHEAVWYARVVALAEQTVMAVPLCAGKSEEEKRSLRDDCG